ncbi:3'(2'),5'-bisphosphate nucleotidase CysQ [Geodermatophilus sabuli]|uniref:3'(2'),5'-bisphosphate nucleotidase n=1 Tax=Geodermatophilus sabuli TaxID=1564158 RepID=A0A285E928_9ACTN|nr:3'(2'),5'-bisphosphate nucleotidase CysQ [Geodermatophilus sabuli]MBB3085075.1 3'(2'), 5'-bisphosphate nucleotidase [Geodermatophilus sabuli]SNX95517.1 3'(2'),5'-bisphosphate nucleotidase [Geodermatophilus sabuli]
MTDVEVAAEVAGAAAAALLQLRADGQRTGRALGDAGDAAAQAAISGLLAARRPGDAVFSEEAVDDPARLSADRVWIVDPLDGTREYGEERPDWAVHVALWADGDLTAAAVALPALGEVLVTDPAPVVPPSGSGRLRIAVSRTRPPVAADAAAAALDAELVPMGSAGYKVTAVVRGEVDAYVHAGGMYQWDSAAPVAVARAAGLTAVRLDGSPLHYNGADPYLPDLVVCRPELADRLLEAVAGER